MKEKIKSFFSKFIQVGSRKVMAFYSLLLAFLIISLVILLLYFTAKDRAFSVSDYSSLFIPLGIGLGSIATPFFTGNVFEHKFKNGDNKDKEA